MDAESWSSDNDDRTHCCPRYADYHQYSEPNICSAGGDNHIGLYDGHPLGFDSVTSQLCGDATLNGLVSQLSDRGDSRNRRRSNRDLPRQTAVQEKEQTCVLDRPGQGCSSFVASVLFRLGSFCTLSAF